MPTSSLCTVGYGVGLHLLGIGKEVLILAQLRLESRNDVGMLLGCPLLLPHGSLRKQGRLCCVLGVLLFLMNDQLLFTFAACLVVVRCRRKSNKIRTMYIHLSILSEFI